MKLEPSFKNSNILITGGAGFIGSNLAHRLVEIGANVEILDSFIEGQGGNKHNLYEISEKIKLIEKDVRNEDIVKKLVREKDFIFHLASQTSHLGSIQNPLNDMDINCRGTLVLLEACRKFNSDVKIIYTGSRSQYGRILKFPVDENHPMNPLDINGISKFAAEQYILLYNRIYGIKTTSLRLTNTYGPRGYMKDDKLGFINWFIRLAMDNMEIKIFDGKQLRDLNYIDDVVEALLMVAINDKTNGEVFNLGSSTPISLLDLTKLIIKITGSGSFKVVPYLRERKNIEIGDYIANTTKIKTLIGWEPKTSLDKGLRTTINYYRKHKKKYW